MAGNRNKIPKFKYQIPNKPQMRMELLIFYLMVYLSFDACNL